MNDQRGRVKPKYQQIADDLRADIASGKLAVGDRIPSLPELAGQYEVAMNTADHALAVLRREGLVQTAHGAGTWVISSDDGQPSAGFAEVMTRLDEMGAQITRLQGRIEQLEREQR